MLNVTVQSMGETTILRCRGRIVTGDETRVLREAVLARPNKSRLVIDLGRVDAIDAGGLGLLMNLRAWARRNGIDYRLVNATGRVRQALEVTHLSRLLEASLTRESNSQSFSAVGTAA